jgi:hypothetical protein
VLIVAALGFWFICAIAGGAIASSKGLSGCMGMALGFLLGPIGLLIVVCLPASPLVVAQAQQIEAGPSKLCPHCRSIIPAAASVCRFCQRESPAALTPATCSHPDWGPGQLYYLERCTACGFEPKGAGRR